VKTIKDFINHDILTNHDWDYEDVEFLKPENRYLVGCLNCDNKTKVPYKTFRKRIKNQPKLEGQFPIIDFGIEVKE